MRSIGRELTALKKLSPKQLREKYTEVTGEGTRSGNRAWLVKRIAWRMQANAEGDLSERARRRAEELAAESDIRVNPSPVNEQRHVDPAESSITRSTTHHVRFNGDRRLPAPGAVIERVYKDRPVHVTVTERGFEYEGERYRSLSAVAKAITGSHVNGFQFFKLGEHAS